MRKHNLTGIAILLVVLTVILAACGGGATPTPEPTNTPEPTHTPQPTKPPVPTVDVASLTVGELQSTAEALEASIEQAHANASAVSGEAAESEAESNIAYFERELAAVQELIAAAGGGMESTEEGETAMTVALALSGDFKEAREWTWDELEALDMITATVAGPRESDPATEYTGVSLMAFLEAAGVGEEAGTLVGTAADGFAVEIDLAVARTCEECMIVLEEGSLRLIMPEFPSNNWVRDLVSLEAQ